MLKLHLTHNQCNPHISQKDPSSHLDEQLIMKKPGQGQSGLQSTQGEKVFIESFQLKVFLEVTMKFGQLLKSYIVPEWKDYYIDYAGIKALLKQVYSLDFDDEKSSKEFEDARNQVEDLTKTLEDQDDDNSQFYKLYLAFASKSQTDVESPGKSRSRVLKEWDSLFGESEDMEQSIRPLLSREEETKQVDESIQIDERLAMVEQRLLLELEKVEKAFELLSSRMLSSVDHLKKESDANLPSDESYYRQNYIRNYRKCNMLINFVIVNLQGFDKISKKTQKVSGRPFRTEFMNKVKSCSFCHSGLVSALMKSILVDFADKFEKGDLDASKVILLSKMTKQNTSSVQVLNVGIKTGLALGFLITSILMIIERSLPASRVGRPLSQYPALYAPIYRSLGLLVCFCWLYGCCVYIWKVHRVNFVYIFELDPYTRLTSIEIWDESANLSLVYLINFVLFLLFATLHEWYPSINLPFAAFPGSLLLFFIVRFFTPFSIVPFWSTRRVVLESLSCVIRAPFARVRFLDTFVGDVLTSMVKVFTDLLHGIIAMVTLQPALHGGYALYISAFLSAAPLFFRFQQCVRRYYDTRKKFPDVFNAAKYALAHSVVILASFHPVYSEYGAEWSAFRVFWLLSIVSSTVYVYLWDILMDWRLIEGSFHQGFKFRQTLLYTKRRYYIFAMVTNLFLRFSWTLTIIPLPINPFFKSEGQSYYQVVFLPLVSFLEIYRRTQWAVIRVENEHISNTFNFRSQDIPVPIYFDSEVEQEKRKGTSSQYIKFGALIEVLVMILLLVVVAVFFAVFG